MFLNHHMKWPREYTTTKVLVDLLLERRRKGKAIKVVDSFHIHNTHFGGSRALWAKEFPKMAVFSDMKKIHSY